MLIRPTVLSDLDVVMNIIHQAQKRMLQACINQWQDGYPDRVAVEADMSHGASYVLEEEGKIVATGAVSFDGDENYAIIRGRWLSDLPYAVIHRLAVADEALGKGLATDFFEFAYDLCRQKGIQSVKVDTHEVNFPMRGLLQKEGFKYCGIITLKRDGSERLAFEKIVDL